MSKQQVAIIVLAVVVILAVVLLGVGITINKSGGDTDADNFSADNYPIAKLINIPVSFFMAKVASEDIQRGPDNFTYYIGVADKKMRKAEFCVEKLPDFSGASEVIVEYSLRQWADRVRLDKDERNMLPGSGTASCTLSVSVNNAKKPLSIPVLRYAGTVKIIDPPKGVRILCNGRELAAYH